MTHFGTKRAKWLNCEMYDGDFLFKHNLKSDKLALLFDSNEVDIGAICKHVNNNQDLRTNQLTIYWKSHSSLVYALTNITYCYAIVIECGSTDEFIFFETPKLYLKQDAVYTELEWPPDIQITSYNLTGQYNIVKRVRFADRDTVFYISSGLDGIYKQQIIKCFQLLYNPPTCAYNEYERFLADAQNQTLMIVPCSRAQHLLLKHVVLFEMGECNKLDMIVNVHHDKLYELEEDKFEIYESYKRRLFTIVRILNSLRTYQQQLPRSNNRYDGHMYYDNVQRFYAGNVDNNTVSYGVFVLQKVSEGHCSSIKTFINKFIKIDNDIEPEDLKQFVMTCL